MSLDSNEANCGACGQGCSAAHGGAACVGGQCELTFCAADYGDCDANANNGCETDLTSDPANCGRCGHDCCGGACSNGQCQPWPLTYAYADHRFALDATDVYFDQQIGGHLYKCPKTGCGNGATQVATGHGADVVDANNIYWTAGNAIMECSKTACDGTTKTLAAGSTSTWTPFALAVDSTTVFWTARIAGGATSIGGVM